MCISFTLSFIFSPNSTCMGKPQLGYCSTAYYSTTIRSLPATCRICGNPFNLKCLKKWTKCIKKKNNKTYGQVWVQNIYAHLIRSVYHGLNHGLKVPCITQKESNIFIKTSLYLILIYRWSFQHVKFRSVEKVWKFWQSGFSYHV